MQTFLALGEQAGDVDEAPPVAFGPSGRSRPFVPPPQPLRRQVGRQGPGEKLDERTIALAVVRFLLQPALARIPAVQPIPPPDQCLMSDVDDRTGGQTLRPQGSDEAAIRMPEGVKDVVQARSLVAWLLCAGIGADRRVGPARSVVMLLGRRRGLENPQELL